MSQSDRQRVELDRIDAAWKIRNDQQDMIKFADQKVGVVLTLSAVLTGFVFTNLRELSAPGAFAIALLVVFVIATIAMMICALRALLARGPSAAATEMGDGGTPGAGLLGLVYFGHIGQRASPHDYWLEFQAVEASGLLRDLCHQNWELARIAGEKYRQYRFTWCCLNIQLGLFAVFAFCATMGS